jgi:hypothetical protein
MASCLGIHFDNNILKYAKLVKNNGPIEIKEYGIRFVRSTVKETIEKIISDTNSTKDVPIVLSAPSLEFNNFQVFKQISTNDLINIIKLEFEDWCEKNSVGSTNYAYVHQLATSVVGDYYRGLMAITKKSLIEEYSKIGDIKVDAMYPTEMLLPTDVPDDEKSYILINLDERLTLTTVVNGKVASNTVSEIGMKQIFDRFIDVLGSYEKAYDACKQLNVFSDVGSDVNKRQLEEIVEPVLQEVLHVVQEDVNKYRDSIVKLYITGSGTLFTNIDTLFTEYFTMRCEILKPKFVTDIGGVRNIAEALEALPAFALAKEFLEPVTRGLEFLKVTAAKQGFFQKLFAKKKDEPKEKVKKEKDLSKIAAFTVQGFSLEKVAEYLMYPVIVGSLSVIAYLVFSNIYMNQINKMKSELQAKITEIDSMTTLANSDRNIISSATNQYKSINDEIDQIKSQIEKNQIGNFRTYNVAAFTQKLIKVIPKNVLLKSISSDDNKHVKIVAESNAYPNLGYLIANLRLQPDILTNVTVTNIVNGPTITIEFGGDLP